MKFAHLADIHLGSWKEPKIRELSVRAFDETISRCVSEKVDFVLISGDLFNTSLPPIESLKTAVVGLKKLKEEDISVYTIAGSHDFSPSGKTMLEVLEEAELVRNVCKGEVIDGKLKLHFTTDPKTGAKITGMLGKKGMLEKQYYEDLLTESLEKETGFKIFLFHTALAELKPEEMEKMDAAPLSLLPRGFDYYAGGHVHIVKHADLEGYKNIVYPGPTFPNSFSELEKLGCGGFYIYNNGKPRHEKIELCRTVTISIDCDHKTPEQVNALLAEAVQSNDVSNALVLLRLEGVLETGKTSEIGTSKMIEILMEKGAHSVMKNASKLSSKEFKEIKVEAATTEEAEKLAIQEHAGQVKSLSMAPEAERELVNSLMTLLDVEKEEGEKQSDYESRIVRDVAKVFDR